MEWLQHISPYAKVIFEYSQRPYTSIPQNSKPRLFQITTGGLPSDFFNVILFNANTNRFAPNYGNVPDVSVISLWKDYAYVEQLANTMPNPFALGKFRLEFYNANSQLPYQFTYYTGMTFFTAAPTGDASQDSIPIFKPTNQFQRTIFETELEDKLWIEGDSGLIMSLRGQTVVKLYIYPEEETSISALLAKSFRYKEINKKIVSRELKKLNPIQRGHLKSHL